MQNAWKTFIRKIFSNSFVLTFLKENNLKKNNEKFLDCKFVCKSLLYKCALAFFPE